jgi:NAD(P)-dependent dehydrogenase (short-subunit alcohol dehydrogenase family)
MREFKGKTAVVTGGAAGIGRALAEKCLAEGMNVVIADVEQPVLESTLDALREQGERLRGRKVDVSQADEVAALANFTRASFGDVHLLFNNAGVGAGSTAWESTLLDWTWVMGVNLWGVIHGIRAFVPAMVAHGEAGYVVNTASIAGLIRGHHSAAYATTKHAVVALSEQLQVEFERTGARLHCAALCPSWVNTRINEGGRNRPEHLRNPDAIRPPSPETLLKWSQIQAAAAKATLPAEIAHFVFEGMRAGKHYLMPHPESKAWVQRRFDGILHDY